MARSAARCPRRPCQSWHCRLRVNMAREGPRSKAGCPQCLAPTADMGGVRGAIAIALVLSLPTELPYWYSLQAMVFSVVLFSSLNQGTSTGWLIRRLGLAGRPEITFRESS